MTDLKTPEGMTKEDLDELVEAVEELNKEPLKGFRRFVRSVLKPIRRKDELEATYAVFHPIAKRAGEKLTKKDCEEIRHNMLRLSKRLYEIHCEKVDEIDSEKEKRSLKNG